MTRPKRADPPHRSRAQAQPAPPPPPVRSASAPVAAPAAQPARGAIARRRRSLRSAARRLAVADRRAAAGPARLGEVRRRAHGRAVGAQPGAHRLASPDVLPAGITILIPAKGSRMTRLTRALLVALAALFAIPGRRARRHPHERHADQRRGRPERRHGQGAGLRVAVGQGEGLHLAAARSGDRRYGRRLRGLDAGRRAAAPARAAEAAAILDLVAIGETPGARAVWNYTVKVTDDGGVATVAPAATAD